MQVIRVPEGEVDPELIEPAARALRAGGLVAFPTETVYGLGANALDAEAVAKIFKAKGRPGDNPLIVHIAKRSDLSRLTCQLPPHAEALIEAFWPGPLTLVLPHQDQVPPVVTAGLATVAVRMPAHPVALALIAAAGVPVAAPSANRSGKPSPTLAEHVADDLAAGVAYLLDGGRVGVGLESTVLDLTHTPPAILRPGSITKEMLEAVAGPVLEAYTLADQAAPKAPGMKYTHYSPEAEVYLVQGTNISSIGAKMLALLDQFPAQRVGLMVSSELNEWLLPKLQGTVEPALVHVLGSRHQLASVAGEIYHSLRSFDKQGATLVLVEEFPLTGVGAAIMNRLLKAAGKVIE